MPLEVRKHKHRVVILEIFTDKILLDDLSLRDFEDEVGTLGVHKVKVEIIIPAVPLYRFKVLFGGVSLAVISGVALDDGPADIVDDRLPERRSKKILIPDLARVNLNRDLAL